MAVKLKLHAKNNIMSVGYLIEKHGGTLHAENLEGGGSRVTFTLPIRPKGEEIESLG